MKGDISNFTVAGDKIYVYTTEWVPGPGNTEDAEAEEESYEAKDQEETADGDAAVAATEDAVVDGDEQSDSTDGTNAISEEGEEKPVDDAEATDGADAEIGDTTDATDDVPDDYYGTTNQYFYTCKADGSDLQEIQMDVEKNDNNWLNYFAATEDGMLYMLYSGYDEKSEQSTYLIKILDAGGSQTGEVNLNGILDENDYVQAMRLDKDGNIYLMGDQSVYVLDKDGNKISYNPPRYEYSYDFYITIFVNNPYFNEMRFQVNSSSIDITPPPSARPGMPARCNPETNVEYRNCKKLGEEIRQMLTQVRKDVRERIEQAAAPKAAITCPYCCATTTPDASGRCEYCGGAVNG